VVKSDLKKECLKMKVDYKSFEIDVYRDKNLSGEQMIFFSVFRKNDKWELTSGSLSGNGEDTIRDWVNEMKSMVDDYLVNPEHYEEDDV
jgi:hypothetical protein